MAHDPQDPAFRAATIDVSPLRTRARERGPRAVPTAGQLRRREEADQEPAPPLGEALSLDDVPKVAPHDIVGGKIEGVQEGVFRKLRLGQYPIEDVLDLHRRTVAEAREQLLRFVTSARARGCRCVLVSHGRGERSETPARIKSYVAHWMTQLSDVIAFHSAQRRHGGTGAMYVLLRKSVASRELNRERFGQKRDDG
jgi:DNA-nicking Smr family endonuclease